MSLNQVNVAVVDNNTIVKTDVLRTETTGSAVKIKAVKGAKYILAEGDNGVAPENITIKRVGKNLHVMLEGSDDQNPQLIIEDFFDNPGELVGKAEDGQWHEYISTDGDSDNDAAFLMDGESSALALGADAIGSLDGLAVAEGAISPALLALGALAGIAALAGLAAIIAHNRDKGDDNGGDNGGGVIDPPPDGGGVVPTPGVSGATDNKGDITGPIDNGGVTDDDTPTLIGEGTPGNIIIIRDENGEDLGSTIVDDEGNWTWTPETPLPDGEHGFIPVEKDPEGNVSEPGEEYVIIVDTTPPDAADLRAVIDDVGIHTGELNSGDVTDDNQPTFEGTAEADAIVEVWMDGEKLGTAIVGDDGNWSFTPEQPIADGKHDFSLIVVDDAGNRSVPSDPFELTIDTVAPDKPGEGGNGFIDDVIDDVGLITGPVAEGGVTDDNQPTLEGSGQQPGDIVTIIDNGNPIGSVIVDDKGDWSFTPDTPLPDGEHDFSLIITDPAGNSSPESDPFPITIDTQAPDAPTIVSVIDDQGAVTGPISNGAITDDAQPQINGTAEANSTVIIYDNGVKIGETQADASGNWSFTPYPPLLNGSHDISAKAQDAAGNISVESNKVDFELIAGGNAQSPAITGAYDDVEGHIGMLDSGDLTNDAQPELRGTAQPGATVSLYVDGQFAADVVADANGQWTFTPTTPLADGVHNFRAEVTDPAGNPLSSGNYQLNIDTTAPDASSDQELVDNVGPVTGPINDGDTTDDSTPTFEGTGEPGDTVIIKDGDKELGSTVVGDDGKWEFTPDTPLEDGDHSLIVIIEDPAGNQSDPSDPIDFVVDTSLVTVSIDYAIDDVDAHTGNMASGALTNDATPTLVGTAKPNSQVEIFDNGVSVGKVQANARGEWSFTPSTDLAEGTHKFTAVATDPAGAVSAPTAEFALDIDLTAPGKPGEGGTGGDGIGDITDDVGPIQGSVKPGGSTDDTTPTLEGNGLQPGDVVTIIDNGKPIGEAVVDKEGNWSFTPDTPLNDGQHDFQIIVTDPAGNSSEPSDPYPIIIDTQAPVTPAIVSVTDNVGNLTGEINPGDITDDATPTLTGTAEKDSTVIIYDNGTEIGRVQADGSGNWTFTPNTPLPNGDHSMTVRSQDTAGNISGESPARDFTLITGGTPAVPAITDVVDDVDGGIVGTIQKGEYTNDNTPTVKGTGADGTTVYIMNGTTTLGSATVVNGRWEFTPTTGLADGTYDLTAYAKDAAGNISPETGEWPIIIDTTAPDAISDAALWDDYGADTGIIASGDTTDDSTPTFKGTAEPGATVIIRDAADREVGRVVADPTTGEWGYTPSTPLPDGDYQWNASQVDKAGNESPASTPIDFTVDTSGNTVSIDYAVDNVGSITDNLTSGSVTDDATPTLHGSAVANATVYIYQDGVKIGEVTADRNGNWSYEVPALAEGQYQFQASVLDAGNVEGDKTQNFTLEIDLTAPNKPAIDDVADDVGAQQGTVANGGYTDDSTPTLSGKGQPGETVTIRNGDDRLGQVQVRPDGTWSWTPSALNDGTYNFNVTLTDAAGNESVRSDEWAVTVDTQAPDVPPTIERQGDQITVGLDNTNAVEGDTLRVVIAGQEVEYELTAADIANGTATVNIPAGIPTAEEYGAGIIDKAGNSSDYLVRTPGYTSLTENFESVPASYNAAGSSQDFGSFTFKWDTYGYPSDNVSWPRGVIRAGYPTGEGLTTPSKGLGVWGTGVSSTNASLTLNGGVSATGASFRVGELTSPLTIRYYDANGVQIASSYHAPQGGNSIFTSSATMPAGKEFVRIEFDTLVGQWIWLDDFVISASAPDQYRQEPPSAMENGLNDVNEETTSILGTAQQDMPVGDELTQLDQTDSQQQVLQVEHADQPIDLSNLAEAQQSFNTVDLSNGGNDVLNVTLGDLLVHAEKDAFIADGNKQLMIQGDEGDVVNLSDLLPDDTDPGNWAKAEGTVTVSGVQYEVFQHSAMETELLVQQGVQTNLNNH